MYYGSDELSERKKLILRAIIDAYIAAGEPVGSKFLTAHEKIPLSSATIRNEMAELEEMGYLEQPHTSAGRVPSERGYRFYVDSLMHSYRLTTSELRELNNLVKNKVAELDGLLEQAGKLTAMLTNYTSLMVKPKLCTAIIMQYKVVRLNSDSFLLIMITSAGMVKTRHIRVSRDIDDEGLVRLEIVLNEHMTGVELESVTLPVMIQLQNRLMGYESLIAPVLKCIYEAANEGDGGELKLEGMKWLLKYPEFADTEKLSGMLALFDRKADIMELVARADKNMTNIYIGTENAVDIMRNSTLIFRTIMSGGHIIGALGVIGPCRMDYSRVVAMVEYLSRNIADMMKKEDENQHKNPENGNDT